METIHKKTSRKTQVPMELEVREELKKMKLTKWVEKVHDRFKWKAIVEKAKTLPEL
jgi:hypothetical protein